MNNKLTNFCRKIYRDPFKRYLVISLIILGIILLFTGQESAKPITTEGFEVHFFYLPDCSHCEEQDPFNRELVTTYSIDIKYHNAGEPKGAALLTEMLAAIGIKDEPEFPVTIFGR